MSGKDSSYSSRNYRRSNQAHSRSANKQVPSVKFEDLDKLNDETFGDTATDCDWESSHRLLASKFLEEFPANHPSQNDLYQPSMQPQVTHRELEKASEDDELEILARSLCLDDEDYSNTSAISSTHSPMPVQSAGSWSPRHTEMYPLRSQDLLWSSLDHYGHGPSLPPGIHQLPQKRGVTRLEDLEQELLSPSPPGNSMPHQPAGPLKYPTPGLMMQPVQTPMLFPSPLVFPQMVMQRQAAPDPLGAPPNRMGIGLNPHQFPVVPPLTALGVGRQVLHRPSGPQHGDPQAQPLSLLRPNWVSAQASIPAVVPRQRPLDNTNPEVRYPDIHFKLPLNSLLLMAEQHGRQVFSKKRPWYSFLPQTVDIVGNPHTSGNVFLELLPSKYMTCHDKAVVLRILFEQLDSSDPLVEDFYYKMRTYRVQCTEVKNNIRRRKDFKADHDKVERPVTSEGSLGKRTFCTFVHPKQVMDVPENQREDTHQNSQGAGSAKLNLLALIEDLYNCLLKAEDGQIRCSLGATDSPNNAIRDSALHAGLLSKRLESMTDQTLLKVLLVAKGKRLIQRSSVFISKACRERITMLILNHIQVLLDRETQEQRKSMDQLLPFFFCVIPNSELEFMDTVTQKLTALPSSLFHDSVFLITLGLIILTESAAVLVKEPSSQLARNRASLVSLLRPIVVVLRLKATTSPGTAPGSLPLVLHDLEQQLTVV